LAQRAEIEYRTVSPKSGVPPLISRQKGKASDPTTIVDAISPAAGPAERIEIGYLILLCRRCLR
jgi:hypothetical protein